MNTIDFDESYFEARKRSDAQRMTMHDIDRKWVMSFINSAKPVAQQSKRAFLDIGCSDGRFLKGFGFAEGNWGIEPNASQSEMARDNGLKMVDSASEVPRLDTVILRGVLHHLPDYRETISKIIHAFTNSQSSNTKFLFLLANPNAGSLMYKKFGRLPALESGTNFNSVYKVHGAKEIMGELNLNGFIGHLHYPYLLTPYSHPIQDFSSIIKSVTLRRYIPSPFPRNMFNLALELIR